MRFKSRGGKEVRIALTNGHVAVVGPDWEELHERFHEVAYSQGCMSEDMAAVSEVSREARKKINDLAAKKASIRDGLLEMIADNDHTKFTRAGMPNLAKLSSIVGFTTDRGMVQEVWHSLTEEGYRPIKAPEVNDNDTTGDD